MAVFSKNMNAFDGNDREDTLRKIVEHIAYLQEAIEFSVSRTDRRLKAVEEKIASAEKAAEEASAHVNQ